VDPLKGAGNREIPTNGDAVNIHYQVKGDGKPALKLLTCMEKMLCLGMPFTKIVKATMSRPAEVLGLKGEAWTLKPGSCVDIAGLVIEKGDHAL